MFFVFILRNSRQTAECSDYKGALVSGTITDLTFDFMIIVYASYQNREYNSAGMRRYDVPELLLG